MHCYVIEGVGIDQIKPATIASPRVQHERDVLVEVHACSLNYRDLMIAKGLYQPVKPDQKPFIPVSDMSGVVKEVGSAVSALKVGDRVLNAPFRHWPSGKLQPDWAKTFIGGPGVDGVLAQQLVYPADALVKIPDFLSFAEASTFPIAALTAWAALVTFANARPGEWVLIQGTGGVSTFAAQLAKSLGLRILLTTSSKEKARLAKEKYGALETVDYTNSDWPDQIKNLTHGNGVDIVVDVTGGNTLTQCLKICAYHARVAVIGVLAGQETTLPIRHLLSRQIQLQGIFMQSTQELHALMKAVETLKIKPAIDRLFSFEHVQEAYRHLESQKHFGKVVVQIST